MHRKKKQEEYRPAVEYDAFRFELELQVASKRQDQMETLKKIIALGSSDKEAPDLLFRYAELLWEESRYLFFEANRQDDDYIRSKNKGDQAGMRSALARKQQYLGQSQQYQSEAVTRYKEIVRRFPRYQRMDEVLYFLGHNLWDENREQEALGIYKLLVTRYQKSRYLPDAYLAFGEYYFDNSKGQRPALLKALAAYKKAASFPENKVYLYALYKQGWCHYNLADYADALDLFKTVILYADLSTTVNKGSKLKLAKDARKDYVLTYSRFGNPLAAKDDFLKVGGPDNWWAMLKGLAGLYYDDGNDKAAVLTYRQLIRERPLSPESPFFQARIVDAMMRVGNKKITTQQAQALVQILERVKASGVVKTEADKKTLAAADDLAERTLSNLAVTWHNEGKKTRDEETYARADEIYRDYLELFPASPKAYDLHFYHGELLYDQLQNFAGAAQEYGRVVARDIERLKAHAKPGRWFSKALEDQVFAAEEVARVAAAKASTPAKSTTALPIPLEQQALLSACDAYLTWLPKGPKVVEVTYKAAQIYYRYNHFDEAVKRFTFIATQHPESDLAVYSANLVLDSYNLLGDYSKVHEWARKFLGMPKLAKGKFHEDLLKLVEESGFKLVEKEEQAGHFEKAATAYLGFVHDFPKGERADQALWNAAADFYKAHDYERSIRARDQLIERYPQSPWMPKALFSNAQSHEARADFGPAAAEYERYAQGYARQVGGGPGAKHRRHSGAEPPSGPKFDEQKAQEALINAAVYRVGLRQSQAALRDREAYLELWPVGRRGSDTSEQVFTSIAGVYETQGKLQLAIKQLEDHLRRVGRDANAYLTVQGRLARLYEKARNLKEARRIDQEILAFYKHASKKRLSPEAFDAVGHASYAVNEDAFAAFDGLRLHLPEKRLLGDVKAKARSLIEVQRIYTETVALRSADPAICALWKIGLAYQKFAQALYDAPIPAQFRGQEQLVQAYKDQLAQQAMPVESKAKEAFQSAVAKSRELGVYNDCSEKAHLALRKYDPASFGDVPELTVALAPSSLAIPPADLLTSLVPVEPPGAGSESRASGVQPPSVAAPPAGDVDDRPPEPPPPPSGVTPAASSTEGDSTPSVPPPTSPPVEAAPQDQEPSF
ncbi:MAG: tetratricopeptide repeat protein [Deltaproteobacteria bacterium]